MARTRSRRGTIALTAALVAAVPTGTFGLVLLSTYVSSGLAWFLGPAIGIAWIVGVIRLVGVVGCWVAIVSVALWGGALGEVLSARDAVILDSRGITVTARIAAAHDSPHDKHPNSTYDLVGELGLPIPNGTVYGGLHSHAVGDRMLIRYDPEGVAAALAPDGIDLSEHLTIAAALNAALMAAVAGLGVAVVRNGRPRRVPFRRAGSVGGTPRDAARPQR
ncbi:hypothetical protein ACIRYZ_17965 [Kitasatospora sp. NPDC101155]|uniref:hypothetical protein n=1 Tax=Kitasatospora sp. NPDC101155 TaxID=3364097 RepID=UPI00380D6639